MADPSGYLPGDFTVGYLPSLIEANPLCIGGLFAQPWSEYSLALYCEFSDGPVRRATHVVFKASVEIPILVELPITTWEPTTFDMTDAFVLQYAYREGTSPQIFGVPL